MSLVKCFECGEKVSDQADSCPHCGFKKPLEEVRTEKMAPQKTDSQLMWDTVATAGKIAMVVCIIIGGCIYIGGNDNRTALEKAKAENENKCWTAKKTGNANYIQYYCN